MTNCIHVLAWDEENKLFRCRTGDCTFSKTWDEVSAVGYRPFRHGVLFVDEDSFKYPDLSPVKPAMCCE